MRKFKKLSPKLKLIVKELKPYNPERVILFGSRARGDNLPDSDFDLVIIKRNIPKNQRRILTVFNLLYKENFKSPIYDLPDIEPQVYTPEEFQKRLKMGDFFVKAINKEGKIIYAKKR
ncbi:MAG: nucleotidyltransferase domain-containing protein [Patescibacteria group bacterium]|nr:nucleotidyltransferase domain-containing protein [Patescibacteria group bacterium]